LPLLGTSQAIRRYEAELRKASGTTKMVAQKQLKAFSNQLAILKNQITVVAIEIGQILAPYIIKLTGYIQSGIEAWRGLSQSTKRTVVILGLIAAAIGPVVIALG